ncbi:MAG: PQQ-dependent sugar dehydrogenase [Panacagrimonas sp.]
MRLPSAVRLLLFIVPILLVGYWQPWSGTPQWLVLNESQAASAEGSGEFSVEVAVKDLTLPWDLAFISDDEILVTEKAGRLLRINLRTGKRSEVSGMPTVTVAGQGGLHAVTLHPAFASNGLIYLSHAVKSGSGVTTQFVRARLDGNALKDLTVLLKAVAETRSGNHFGGAMAFDAKGFLYLSVGDRGERDEAQNLANHHGKILRLKDDGSVPADNPFVNTPGARPEIYSYGHRNPQGMSLDAGTGQLWAVEHGPRGGDEVNRILPGRNYGWPVITYGKEYVGGSIGEGTAKPGMEQPVHHYVPSIATAGMAYYQGDLFPQWKDSIFIAALRGTLSRVQLKDGRFVLEQRLLEDRKLRLRAVRVSPRGELWVVADEGVILRVSGTEERT